MLRTLLPIVLAAGLAGCAHNPLNEQYRPTVGTPPRAPHKGDVQVFDSFSLLDDVDKNVSAGYTIVGTSSYITLDPPATDSVIGQAQRVGATLVIMSSEP